MRLTTRTDFISTKLFFVLEPDFDISAEIHQQQEMLKIHVACSLAPYVVLSSSIYLITNQAVDAVKAIVHTVNMKFRKINKNDVRNIDNT